MPRRRRKPLWTRLLLWAAFCAIAAWGIWQGAKFRAEILEHANRQKQQAAVAVGSATVTPQGALGGQPWLLESPSVEGLDAPDQPEQLQPETTSVDTQNLHPLPVIAPERSAEELILEGEHLLNIGQAVPARFALNAALARTTDEALAARLRHTLAAINESVFLGTDVLPDDPAARLIIIQPNDNFLRLARTYGLTGDFLQSLNPTLKPQNLKPLSGLKIVQGPFHARIWKRQQRLDLYARELFVKSIPITFPEGNVLPRGEYQVAPSTKLQLGSRTWIGFEGLDDATRDVTNGWIFGSAGPRGTTLRDRTSGIELTDRDLATLYLTLTEGRSRLRVEQ